MPSSLGATYAVSADKGEEADFHSLKDALGYIRDMGYDDWKVVRRETIEQVVASSLEQNEY